jgi:hypothetical protein
MNKFLALAFCLTFACSASIAAGLKNTSSNGGNPPATDFTSPTAWRGIYFIAITKKKPGEIRLSQETMSSLLGAINARSAIYTGGRD